MKPPTTFVPSNFVTSDSLSTLHKCLDYNARLFHIGALLDSKNYGKPNMKIHISNTLFIKFMKKYNFTALQTFNDVFFSAINKKVRMIELLLKVHISLPFVDQIARLSHRRVIDNYFSYSKSIDNDLFTIVIPLDTNLFIECGYDIDALSWI